MRDRLVLALFLEFLAAFVLVGTAMLAVRLSQPVVPTPLLECQSLAQVVHDHDLLTIEQKREAIRTGYAAFDACGMHYVVEGIAREYTL